MEDIERLLDEGNTVVCVSCPNEIKKGDSYVIRGQYMYCDKECADSDDVMKSSVEFKRRSWGKEETP